MTIEVLDLNFQGRPQCVASFLVSGSGRPVLVECGPASSRSQLLEQLGQRGVKPQDLQALLVTHIHLDHAGDAGWWAQQGVAVVVHPLGAPHLVDPSKLLASAGRIYGEHMQRLWGDIVACPAEMVRVAELNATVPLEGLEVLAWDSPGHARHHLAFEVEGELLCGDVAGVSLPPRQQAVLSVPAPPPEFEREVWLQTLDKLQKRPLNRLWLTHYGAIDQVDAHFNLLRSRIEEVAEFVGSRREMPRDQLVTAYGEWQRPMFPDQDTYDRYEQANPLFMSVDGLLRYWKKRSG